MTDPRSWRDARSLVPYVTAGLAVGAIVDLGALAAGRSRLHAAQALATGYTPRILDQAHRSDGQLFVLGAVGSAAYLVTVVLWLVWFSRAYHDAGLLRRVRHPDFAVRGWLIPFVNVVLPKRMMNDAWRAGDATPRGVPPVVHLWWLFFVGAAFSRLFAPPVAAHTTYRTNAADLASFARVLMLSSSLNVLAAACAVVVVRDVTVRLHRRGEAAGLVDGRRGA